MRLVSTIIPVFNRSLMICDAVESVLQQTHPAIEIILVDDGSTDQTPDTLLRLQAQNPDTIKLLRQENAGPGVARNTDLGAATGEFIQYLDSDDVLHPEKFTRQVATLEANPECGVCYCITLRTDPKSNELVPWARTAETIDNIFPSFLPKRGWATLTPLWRRSVCDAVGPWKPFRVMEDWEHDLRAGIIGTRPIHVAEALCTVRDHQENRASGMKRALLQIAYCISSGRMNQFGTSCENVSSPIGVTYNNSVAQCSGSPVCVGNGVSITRLRSR